MNGPIISGILCIFVGVGLIIFGVTTRKLPTRTETHWQSPNFGTITVTEYVDEPIGDIKITTVGSGGGKGDDKG